MSITKNVLLNWYSSMKKKMRKIWMIFDIENWLWKSNFVTFWQLAVNPKFNNFLWVFWFLGKTFFNFITPAWQLNSPYYNTLPIPSIPTVLKPSVFCLAWVRSIYFPLKKRLVETATQFRKEHGVSYFYFSI